MPPRKKKKPKGQIGDVQAMGQGPDEEQGGGDGTEGQASGHQEDEEEGRASCPRADKAKTEENQQDEKEGREIRRRADREKAEERRQRQAQTAKDLMEMIAVPEGMVRYGQGDDAVFPGPRVQSIRRVREMWVDALRRAAGCGEDGEEKEQGEGEEREIDDAEGLKDPREWSEVDEEKKPEFKHSQDCGEDGEREDEDGEGEGSTDKYTSSGSSMTNGGPVALSVAATSKGERAPQQPPSNTLRHGQLGLRKRPREDYMVPPKSASLPTAPTPHANPSQDVPVNLDPPLSSNCPTNVLGSTSSIPVFARKASRSSSTEQGPDFIQHHLALICDQAHTATSQTTSTRATIPALSRPSALPSQIAPVHTYTDQLAYHHPSDIAHAVFAPAHHAMPTHNYNQTSTGAYNRPDYHAPPYDRNHHNMPPPYLPAYHFDLPFGQAPLDIARPSGMYTLDTLRPIDIAPSNQPCAPWPDGYPLQPLYTPCYYTLPLPPVERLFAPAAAASATPAASAPSAAYAFPPTPPPDKAGTGTTGKHHPLTSQANPMTTITTTTQHKDTYAGQWADAWAASGGFEPSVALPLSSSSSSSSSLDVLLFSDLTGKNGQNTSASPP